MAVLALAERGKRGEIYRLGLTMGATHTVGVLILGGFFIVGSALIPSSTIPLLGIISGSLISVIGLFYLMRHFKHLNQHRAGKGHHHHEANSQRIALLGVVGGMVPTPTALTVLVGTAALGSAWYGVLLVFSYGVGMTAVLIFTGQVLAGAYRYLERVSEPGNRSAKILSLAPFVAASIQILAGIFLVTISYGALI
jgi:ABC-type nickel/cobalt efflux system permease component RcnA